MALGQNVCVSGAGVDGYREKWSKFPYILEIYQAEFPDGLVGVVQERKVPEFQPKQTG